MASTTQYVLKRSPIYVSGSNVGIGTTLPVYTFQVNGDISGTRLCIGSDCRSNWPGGGIAGSGSSGQVTFWTGSTSVGGDNNLFWDNTNKRLGIGTTTPQTSLHVVGNVTANTFLGTISAANVSSGQFGANTGGGNYYFMGNVGIGTTAPNNLLQVVDLINFNNTDFNTFLGYQAGKNVVAGAQYNTFIGYQAGFMSSTAASSTAGWNTAIGYQTLFNNTIGYSNTALGYHALYSNTTGYLNTAVGELAGAYIADGITGNATSTYSIYLGPSTRASFSGATNEIVIGYNAVGAGSNSVVLGNDSITKTILKGNVGIGTTAPGYKLDVAGNIRTTGCVVYNGGTLGTCVSDIRLKDNITDLSFNNALTKVLSLKPKQFTLKNDPSQKISGLIAQDVEQIAPELVVTDEKGYKQIKYGDIQWLIIEAIKEQQKEIEELKAQIQNSKH